MLLVTDLSIARCTFDVEHAGMSLTVHDTCDDCDRSVQVDLSIGTLESRRGA